MSVQSEDRGERRRASWYKTKPTSPQERADALRKEHFFRPQLMADLENQLASVRQQLVELDHSDRMLDILKASESRLETDIKSLCVSV